MRKMTQITTPQPTAAVIDVNVLMAKIAAMDSKLNSLVSSVKEGFSSISALSAGHQKLVPVLSVRDLPIFVSHKLRSNTFASRLFLETLTRVGKYIGRNLTSMELSQPEYQPYIGWKWHHLYHALINLGLIDANTKRTAYVKFICQILPDKKPANVSRGFYRTYDNNPSIISDIEDTFRPVVDLLEAA